MPQLTHEEIEALLSEPEVGVLCTVDRHSRPEGSPVWFEGDARELRVLVHRDSKKARNIRGNPHVSLTVDTRVAPYKGVVLRGTATLGGPDATLRRRLAVRYLGETVAEGYLASTPQLDAEDALITIRVTSTFSWDYAKGF